MIPSLLQLSESYQDISVNVKLSDLLDAFRQVAKEIHESYEAEKAARDENMLLSRRRVADLLGVDFSTLWRWDKTGYLKPVRQGRRTSYRKGDIDDLMGRR